METNDIEERLQNLEARQRLLVDALINTLKDTKLDHRPSFAIYALSGGFSATEMEEIEAFFRWVTEERRSGKLTLEGLTKKFEERLPRQKDSLKSIAQGYRVEGKFPYACDFILGEETR